MIDVSSKFNTLRYAKAEGWICTEKEIIDNIKNGKIPKGDVFEISRAAGINASKKTSELITFCHPVPLDWVSVSYELFEEKIKVISEIKAVWKTGVEMEALTAVYAALLNIYDMLKPLTNNLIITDIKVVEKRGGKSSFKDEFYRNLKSAVLIISDSAFKGEREDKSGKIIKDFLTENSIEVQFYEILPDNKDKIKSRLIELADKEKVDLIFTTGGTGLGPKDLTPEAASEVIEKEIPGIAEAIRKYGKDRTPYSMLSREISGIRNKSVIINLPGSSRGAEESMHALFPGLLHIFPMIYGAGHFEGVVK
jgi:molybdenum cofactor biosynthesis protein MoaC